MLNVTAALFANFFSWLSRNSSGNLGFCFVLLLSLLTGCRPQIYGVEDAGKKILPDNSASVRTGGVSQVTPATALKWEATSPISDASVLVSWQPSTQLDAQNQTIQFFSDALCSASVTTETSVATLATTTYEFNNNDASGTFYFHIKTYDSKNNVGVSDCSAGMTFDFLTASFIAAAGSKKVSTLQLMIDPISLDADKMYVTQEPGCVSGGTWIPTAISPVTLAHANAANTIYVKFKNTSLNKFSKCISKTIEHDNVAPVTVLFSSFSPSSGALTLTPTIKGQVDGTASVLRFFRDDQCVQGVGSGLAEDFTGSGIPLSLPEYDRTYAIHARAYDAAGNESACQSMATFVVGDPGGDTGRNVWLKTMELPIPRERVNHSTIWTGSEVILWGGSTDAAEGSEETVLNSGAIFNPSTQKWREISLEGAPSSRHFHTAVWTGSKMIVYGGKNKLAESLNSGGIYDPSTDTWTSISSAGVLDPRHLHSAVWTGTKMIVWGGQDALKSASSNAYADGATFDPETGVWTAISAIDAPQARYAHSAIWTGTKMIIWGGDNTFENSANGGAMYSPETDSWVAMSVSANIKSRAYHTAVWTGARMLVYGGENTLSSVKSLDLKSGSFDPEANVWTALRSPPTTFENRKYHSAVWTGSRMMVCGGKKDDATIFSDCISYSPTTNTWISRLTPSVNLVYPRYRHSAVWTGSRLFIWGGTGVYVFHSDGALYNPNLSGSSAWTKISHGSTSPSARDASSAVWTGSKMIVWGGAYGYRPESTNTGYVYDPTTSKWSVISSVNAPSARWNHSAVWTGSKMIVWGGENPGPTWNGGIYDFSTDQWSSMSTAGAPTQRYSPTVFWTGSKLILWGGQNGAEQGVNSGGVYDPSTDQWSTINTVGGPGARTRYASVWTGTELIVWGGAGVSNSGFAYNPDTDSWRAISSVGAPSARSELSAVWTGTEMIFWGGLKDGGMTNSGGAYNPTTDSWRTIAVAPTGFELRRFHQSVWTGSKMFIWGGRSELGQTFGTSASYDPLVDSWTVHTQANAPVDKIPFSFRYQTIWTGDRVLLWGNGPNCASGAEFKF